MFAFNVSSARLVDGGYQITHNVPAKPSDKRVLIVECRGRFQYINIEEIRYKLFDIRNISVLFKAFHILDAWSAQVTLQIGVQSRSGWAPVTEKVAIVAPVRPVNSCGIELAKDATLLYPPNPTEGRTLFNVGSTTSFGGFFYFVHAGKLETDNRYRGFDCSSFVKTALGIRSDRSMGMRGRDFAGQVGMAASFTCKTIAEVVQYVTASASVQERSIIQLPRHVVLVDKGLVYEFNMPKYAASLNLLPVSGSRGGFVTPIQQWRSKDTKHTEIEIYSHIPANLRESNSDRFANIA